MHVILESLDLAAAERRLCIEALHHAGTIIDAASLLGITRHALKRRITKHNIMWPPSAVNINGPSMAGNIDFEGNPASMHMNGGANVPGMAPSMMNPNLVNPNHHHLDHSNPAMGSDAHGMPMQPLAGAHRVAPQMNAVNHHLGYPANNQENPLPPNMGPNMMPNPSPMMPIDPADPHKYR